MFFRSGSFGEAIRYLGYILHPSFDGFRVFSEYWLLGISSRLDLLLILAGIAVLIAVDLFHEHGIRLRDRIFSSPLPVRWLVYECAIFAFLLMGKFISDGTFLYERF